MGLPGLNRMSISRANGGDDLNSDHVGLLNEENDVEVGIQRSQDMYEDVRFTGGNPSEIDPLSTREELKNADGQGTENGRMEGFFQMCEGMWSVIGYLFFVCRRIPKFFCQRSSEYFEREIVIGENPRDRKFPPNVVHNQKYNLITFIPVVLLEQFKYFQNLYFLVIAITQFVPILRIGPWYTVWGPLCFILAVTIIREGFDDFNRRRRDRYINYKSFLRFHPVSSLTPSCQLKVGDIIEVQKGERIPADLILLKTAEDQGDTCFIRTDQLDGETDWKLRIPVAQNESVVKNTNTCSKYVLYAEKPQKDIHCFLGTITKTTVSESGEIFTEERRLDIQNTLWANCVLAAGSAIGVVIYTGDETRAVLNSSKPRSKVALTDLEINLLIKILFTFVIALAVPFGASRYTYFLRYVILFSYVVPMSLRVNMEMAKMSYSYSIYRDEEIPGTLVRSTTIPEDLGRISYLLTDKTGTLTQNQMTFKHMYVGGNVEVSLKDATACLKRALTEQFGVRVQSDENATDCPNVRIPVVSDGTESVSSNGGAGSSMSNLLTESGDASIVNSSMTMASSLKSFYNWEKKRDTERVMNCLKAIAICHNVTPVFERREGEDEHDLEVYVGMERVAVFQSSSPDEIALVEYAKLAGLSLAVRDQNQMIIKVDDPHGFLKYKILEVFSFTSDAKRMGIIVRDEDTAQITFYLKGADTVMKGLVREKEWLDEACETMSMKGLRTLVVAKKELSEAMYDDFQRNYNTARCNKSGTSEEEGAVRASIESNMELLCVTGVEDTLQQDVQLTLEKLESAGISTWMLTGDKLETALCIARSSRLFHSKSTLEVFEIKDIRDRIKAHTVMRKYREKCRLVDAGVSSSFSGRSSASSNSSGRTHHSRYVEKYNRASNVNRTGKSNVRRKETINGMESKVSLVIEGDSLQQLFCYYEKEFMELALKAPAVVVCRCTPTQKATVAELIQKYTGKKQRVAAIGDGGNDVSMIQAADVGIGIEGKEGKQASLAADFSITQFSYLAPLLFVHGRYSYKRSANLAHFIIHRGLIITVMQAIFSSMFYFSSVALFQGFLMIGYTSIYTVLPVLSLVKDKDMSRENLLRYPNLYAELRKGRALTLKTFLIWVLIGMIQGGIIMYGAFLLFPDDFINVISISFTSLIFTELMMVIISVDTINYTILACTLVSAAVYVLSLTLFPVFDTGFIISANFIWKVVVITISANIPIYAAKILRNWMAPPDHQRLDSKWSSLC